MHTVSWDEVKAFIGSPTEYFKGVDGKTPEHLNAVGETYWSGEVEGFNKSDRAVPTQAEKRHHFINQVSLHLISTSIA